MGGCGRPMGPTWWLLSESGLWRRPDYLQGLEQGQLNIQVRTLLKISRLVG